MASNDVTIANSEISSQWEEVAMRQPSLFMSTGQQGQQSEQPGQRGVFRETREFVNQGGNRCNKRLTWAHVCLPMRANITYVSVSWGLPPGGQA